MALTPEKMQALDGIYGGNLSSDKVTKLDQIYGQGNTSLGQDMGTAARGFSQGVTAGYGDELMSGVAATTALAKAKLTGDNNPMTFGELYNQSMGDEANSMAEDQKNSPWIYGLSNLAGSVATGKAAAGRLAEYAPKAAAFLDNSATKTGQIIKSGARGAVQGAIYGSGAADVTNGQSRLENSGKGAIIGGALGAGFGALGGKQINQGNRELNSAIINGTENSKQELGDKLGTQILQAGKAAKDSKSEAYNLADAAGDRTIVQGTDILSLGDKIDQALDNSKISPSLSPAINVIKSATKKLKSDVSGEGVTGASYNRIESLRKEINAIPFTAENSVAKSVAKQALDEHVKHIFEKGLISGDEDALRLITEARTKNAYWKDNFSGKNANLTLKKYVLSEGDSLTPENLVDKMTSYTQAGFDAVRAAKEVLGESAVPILKQGFISKFRKEATDLQGNISPTKLAKSIQKFTSNDSLANQVFDKAEVSGLKNLSYAASNIKDVGRLSRLSSWAGSKVPIIGGLIEDVAKKAKQQNVVNQLQTAGQVTNYQTLFGLGNKLPTK